MYLYITNSVSSSNYICSLITEWKHGALLFFYFCTLISGIENVLLFLFFKKMLAHIVEKHSFFYIHVDEIQHGISAHVCTRPQTNQYKQHICHFKQVLFLWLDIVKVLSSRYFEISNKFFLSTENSTLLWYKTIVNNLYYCNFIFNNYPYLNPYFLSFIAIGKILFNSPGLRDFCFSLTDTY